MILPASWTFFVIVTGIVLVAGATNGLAGFGFAVVGTMALATLVDPATAVVFMILPILAVNISLVRDLSRRELRTCSQRFGPLIGAALIGTVVGMAVLDRLPEAPLRVGLGLLTLGFVATAQQRVPLPGWVTVGGSDLGKTPLAMVGIGGVSGALFGGTNVGVQLVAYLRSFGLSHSLFVGVVALVFLGLSATRVVFAGVFGLYPSMAIAGASLLAAVPAVAGVVVGKRLRVAVSERGRRAAVLTLLSIIGFKLIADGLGIA